MNIKFKNTLAGKIQEFRPQNPPKVTMYNCGPTVYDDPHIGNMRSYIFSDLLRRTLEMNGYDVKQVVNITDVGHLNEETSEDKMETIAKKESKKVQDIAKHYTKKFHYYLELLNIKTEGTKFPKASEFIKEQIDFIKGLEEKGLTYQTSTGIYFDTSKFPDYGKLGNIDTEGLEGGSRVKDEGKKNKTDFALWRFPKKGEKREQVWESPWGEGFPGWHIECSAMSKEILGQPIDIHTGGVDHIPVHHNNEIAQSESLEGKPLARYWLHNAHLNLQDAKMSKSEGNILSIEDLIEKGISPMAYKYWLLQARYSTPIEFSMEALESAKNSLNRITNTLLSFDDDGSVNKKYLEDFERAMNNDLDSPKALSVLWEVLRDENLSGADKKATALEFDKVLGLNFIEIQERIENMILPPNIKRLIDKREKARKRKDFDKSDEIRNEIEELGYEVRDTDEGVRVRKK